MRRAMSFKTAVDRGALLDVVYLYSFPGVAIGDDAADESYLTSLPSVVVIKGWTISSN